MKKSLLWIVVILFITGMACNLPIGLGAGSAPAAGLPDPDAESFSPGEVEEALLEPVALSGAQRQVLAVRGIPNRFTIRFSGEIREETWVYDGAGYEITFRNGETYTDHQGDPVSAALVLESEYVPWWFNGAMSLNELLAATGSDTFALESLEEVFGEEVSLITLPGMDAGFRGEELLFVRAIPMEAAVSFSAAETEPVEPASEPDANLKLTAAEQVHEGTHAYDVYCTYSDGLIDEYSDTITWSFTEDGLYQDDYGPYPWVTENYYSLIDEYGNRSVYFKEDIITITAEFYEADEDGELVLISMVCGLTME
ncbi:hypothetical protein KQH50_00825 [bacterium]|nr:hypothetical protein [bacterium]